MGADLDAAKHVLESPAILRSQVAHHLSTDADGFFHVDWESIKELGPTLSDGEVALINIAHALYNGQASAVIDGGFGGAPGDDYVTLPTAWQHLDDEHFVRVLEALAIKRGLRISTWPADQEGGA